MDVLINSMNLFHNIYAGQNLTLYTLNILQFCQLHNLHKVEKKKRKLKQFFLPVILELKKLIYAVLLVVRENRLKPLLAEVYIGTIFGGMFQNVKCITL